MVSSKLPNCRKTKITEVNELLFKKRALDDPKVIHTNLFKKRALDDPKVIHTNFPYLKKKVQ